MTPEELRRGTVRRVAQLLAQRVAEAVVLFASAGTFRYMGGFIYTATTVVLLVGNGLYVYPRNPEIIVERGKRHEGTAAFDKVVMVVFTAAYLALLVVGALDAGRFLWAPLGLPWMIVGVALHVLGMIPVAGAMVANRNLEPTVRIQSDRGHEVAKTGPYRWVRHPMYAGMLLSFPGAALMLGSTWALVPAAAVLAALVVRTALEDRKLRKELPGYEAYTKETRWSPLCQHPVRQRSSRN